MEALLKRSFDLTITNYSKKGHGLAFLKTEEKKSPVKVEVVSTVVGDRLEVALGKRKKGAYQGEMLQLIEPSSARIQPRCEHAGICGGCSWQQLDYQMQLKEKEIQLRHLFKPFPEAIFHPIIPCDDPWYYRNKMEFSFSENKKGEKFLGLVMTGSRGKVLNLNSCHLSSHWFVKITHAIMNWWESRELKAFHPPSGTGSLRTLTVREGKRTGKKMVFLTVSGNHDHFVKQSDLTTFKEAVLNALPGEDPTLYLCIHHAEKGRATRSYEMHLHGPDALHELLWIREKVFHFNISPSSFFQPNTLQAEKLYERALALVNPNQTMRVYDLYAGCGSIGMIFAPFVKKVIGIESSSYAVCDAEVNLEHNRLTNMKMIRGDVGEVLSEFQLTADLAIIDPPRCGLDSSALKHLIRLSPEKILYISCNPHTQCENIFELVKEGYKLKAIQPLDQFPQTPHIENISFLEK